MEITREDKDENCVGWWLQNIIEAVIFMEGLKLKR